MMARQELQWKLSRLHVCMSSHEPLTWLCRRRAAIMSVCHRLALRLAGIDGGGGLYLDYALEVAQAVTLFWFF